MPKINPFRAMLGLPQKNPVPLTEGMKYFSIDPTGTIDVRNYTPEETDQLLAVYRKHLELLAAVMRRHESETTSEDAVRYQPDEHTFGE